MRPPATPPMPFVACYVSWLLPTAHGGAPTTAFSHPSFTLTSLYCLSYLDAIHRRRPNYPPYATLCTFSSLFSGALPPISFHLAPPTWPRPADRRPQPHASCTHASAHWRRARPLDRALHLPRMPFTYVIPPAQLKCTTMRHPRVPAAPASSSTCMRRPVADGRQRHERCGSVCTELLAGRSSARWQSSVFWPPLTLHTGCAGPQAGELDHR